MQKITLFEVRVNPHEVRLNIEKLKELEFLKFYEFSDV